MRTGRLVVVGAVLPLLLGASLGNLSTTEGEGTWAYPMQPTAFLVLSLGLAVSHLLVLLGYLKVARRSTAAASRFAMVAGVGTAVLAACEVGSGLLARTDLDASVITVLNVGYAISSIAIVVGTLVAGAALRGSRSRLAPPLLVNGLFLLAAMPVRFFASDGLGIAALTIWSLLYVWLGLRLGVRNATVRTAAGHADRSVRSRNA